ncbi:hypothetical protein ALO95_102215 [Pseudomonas syringae pv. antirrhini]|uniref:Uncharacterized protein n=5 Tax=Pseudomonas syringae group TaxID=136849 RepID=A0A3M5QUD5_9PSED|nr:hypothetical protein ALO87_102429 [Pseudomonas syringae pv. apii]KPW44013.1 hypothetical protein ALO88_102620 [Pseudomonas syringae pv. antirrhini]RMM09644.1 hypothetical protein ALQ85_102465 [Pseudomonas syringae]RMM71215.1 hypothetical protein ALQ72_100820 [Pseudomonas syringae pv. maculicola]RMO85514.1 hypothetical protein ALQ32_102180 [Pseudomonas syringae pv. tagetis]RMR17573.1 hypothetical protein ALP89_102495 [Pseudomonas syringae pv. persicae]RMR33855.1 hypothetical protein ALP87_1
MRSAKSVACRGADRHLPRIPASKMIAEYCVANAALDGQARYCPDDSRAPDSLAGLVPSGHERDRTAVIRLKNVSFQGLTPNSLRMIRVFFWPISERDLVFVICCG